MCLRARVHVCVCVCVYDLYKCILVTTDEPCKTPRASERRGAMQILLVVVVIINRSSNNHSGHITFVTAPTSLHLVTDPRKRFTGRHAALIKTFYLPQS